jgi:hypothetical protein
MDDAMMDAPTLGVIRSYDDLHVALRARAEQLNISRETINEISGMHHAAKLLAPKPHRNLGKMSFTALLGALGCRLLLVEEEAETLEKLRERWVQRNEAQVRWRSAGSDAEGLRISPDEADEATLKRRFFAALGAIGGKRYVENSTSGQRARAARRAARARWRKAREATA